MKKELQDLDFLGKEQLKRFANMPDEFRKALENIPAKRAEKVANRILKVGYCTTEWLQSVGYEHAPRAARDLRERGFQLETLYYKAKNGRARAVYILGDFKQIQKQSKSKGRMTIDAKIKKKLVDKYGSFCFIWLENISKDKLQVDHRIPFEISGESAGFDNIDSYMLLSASANRQKSWTCEHCENWKQKDINHCKTCFWAYPENYTHVAGENGIVVPIKITNQKILDKYADIVKKLGAKEAKSLIEYAVIEYLEEMN